MFYYDIEHIDWWGIYYEKFRFRYFSSAIFERLFRIDFFKGKLKELFGTDTLEKFLNALLNDCAHCLEEGVDSLQKIKKTEDEIEWGKKLDKEEEKMFKQTKSICTSNF